MSRPLRAVSRWEVVALSLNDVIGGGIYLLPAAAALYLGNASVWAVFGAGCTVLLLVLCFAEAGSLFDEPGSSYVYARTAFGGFVGFEVGWMTWISRVAALSGLSAGFAQAVVFLWPAATGGLWRDLTIAAPLLVLTWINVLGVKSGARTSVYFAIGKIVPLVAFIGIGIFAVSWNRIFPVSTPGVSPLGETVLLFVFAYGGFENTAAAAGEFKNPQRDVPFALLIQIATVTAIYTAVQLVAVGTLRDLASSRTPLADAAHLLLGPSGGWMLTAGAAVSILGAIGNSVLSGPRYLYALAENGRLPSVFARVHPRYRTPYVAILTQTAIVLPLALSGTFAGLASLSVVARLTAYMGTAAAVPVLRRTVPSTARAIRLPGGATIPAAALLVCFALLSLATRENLVAGAVALAIGAAVFTSSAAIGRAEHGRAEANKQGKAAPDVRCDRV